MVSHGDDTGGGVQGVRLVLALGLLAEDGQLGVHAGCDLELSFTKAA